MTDGDAVLHARYDGVEQQDSRPLMRQQQAGLFHTVANGLAFGMPATPRLGYFPDLELPLAVCDSNARHPHALRVLLRADRDRMAGTLEPHLAFTRRIARHHRFPFKKG
jgi:hypothetical protein